MTATASIRSRRAARAALAGLMILALGACASLVTPNVKAEPEALRTGAYELDKAHAALLFKIDHLGFSKYIGRFNSFDAALDFDAETPDAARLEVIIDMASLDVNNPEFEETLRGDDWFNAAQFPQAVFRSTAIEITGDQSGRLTGNLTLLGVTQPVTLDVTFNGGANNLITGRYTVGFEAHGSFSRSAFGLDNLVPAIGDEVELEIHAEFLRQ